MNDAMVARRPECTACIELIGGLPLETARRILVWVAEMAQGGGGSTALSRAVRALNTVAEVDRSSVLIPRGPDALEVLASSEPQRVGDLMISLDRYPELDHVVRSGEPLLIESVEGNELLAPFSDSLRSSGVIGIAAVPFDLAGRQAIWHVISRSRPLSRKDLDLLLTAVHLAEHWLAARIPPAGEGASWQELVEGMADVVLEVAGDGRVMRARGPLLDRLEVDPRALADAHLAECLGPAAGTANGGVAWVSGILQEPRSWTGARCTLALPDTGPVDVELWAAPLPGAAATARIVLRTLDPLHSERETRMRSALKRRIVELEKLHEQLGKAEDLRARFLSASAHELKTPLTVIQSYLEILITDLSAGLGEEQLSFLTIAYDSVLRLRRLVLDLVDLAAMESGRIHLDICRVDLGPLITSLVEEMRPLANRVKVRLSAADSGPLPGVRGDATRIRQVLHNLVENAIKNTPSGGKVEVGGLVEQDSVVMTVRDNGIGIPADQLASIFDEYVQVQRAPEEQRPGSGLGLAICRRIVQNLGGRISVESREGEGSLFEVHLPSWPREDSGPRRRV
jgi:signal transduction histidine kinase